jgi:hypothetical protein
MACSLVGIQHNRSVAALLSCAGQEIQARTIAELDAHKSKCVVCNLICLWLALCRVGGQSANLEASDYVQHDYILSGLVQNHRLQ